MGSQLSIDPFELFSSEFWIEEVLDIRQGRVLNLVPIRQDVDAFRIEVDKHVVVVTDTVSVRGTLGPSSLEILAVDEAAVDVVVTERDGAQSFEIEIECRAVNL